MSLENNPQYSPYQRVREQNSHDVIDPPGTPYNATNLAVQQSLQEIFDEFTTVISSQLRSNSPEDLD